MIEKPPKISGKDKVMGKMMKAIEPIISKINAEFAYWDTVKYKQLPEGCSPQQLWYMVKQSRAKRDIMVWEKYGIHLSITDQMLRTCHELDLDIGGSWMSNDELQNSDKERYLVSSLMEEAISSSVMEGAVTTRVVAKEMLRKKIPPHDTSQQMIANNYATIQYVAAHRNEPLTLEGLLHVHELMTEKTLERPEMAGHFRENDEVVVADVMQDEVIYRPPSYKELPQFVTDLCEFFNHDDELVFIHPIIRGIIIHFMIAYMHPFVDGNGRTARALFYWYMMKEKYPMTEYLSISRVIARSKRSYEKSFRYVEYDNNDIGYFVAYNLDVLCKAYEQFQQYIKRKTAEKENANSLMAIGGINDRQSQILQRFILKPAEVVTVKDIEVRYGVTPMTARHDLMVLVGKGLLKEVDLNQRKRGYIRSEQFDELIQKR